MIPGIIKNPNALNNVPFFNLSQPSINSLDKSLGNRLLLFSKNIFKFFQALISEATPTKIKIKPAHKRMIDNESEIQPEIGNGMKMKKIQNSRPQ